MANKADQKESAPPLAASPNTYFFKIKFYITLSFNICLTFRILNSNTVKMEQRNVVYKIWFK